MQQMDGRRPSNGMDNRTSGSGAAIPEAGSLLARRSMEPAHKPAGAGLGRSSVGPPSGLGRSSVEPGFWPPAK
jgi:hypothetical protein